MRVQALNGETPSAWSDPSGAVPTNSATNNAPVFSETAPTRVVPENLASDQNVGDAVTATDADGDTLEYTLEGTDASSFDIVSTSGQIQTTSGVTYDYEATKNSYEVTVKASDGTASATIDVEITVTDADEQPDTPAKPTLAAVSGSSTRLVASWTAPGLNGGPELTGYNVEYREGTSGDWETVTHSGTGTTTTITGLTASTEYQVHVQALNGEKPSGWSDPSDAVRTNAETSTCTLETGDRWCGVVTVGTYSDGVGFSDSDGALTDNTGDQTITIGSSDYTVSSVVILVSQPGALVMGLDTRFPTGDEETLEFHIGSSTFKVSEATFEDGVGYYWLNSGLSWSVGDMVDVRLRRATDDDAPTISVQDQTVNEGDLDPDNLLEDEGFPFQVTLSAASGEPVRFKIRRVELASDTATDDDLKHEILYLEPGEMAAGETSVYLRADIILNDTLDEPDETFTLELYDLENATAGKTRSTITIADDDDPPSVSVADAEATEGDPAEFAVTLSAASGQTVTVGVATSIESSDTALAGDFTAVPATTLTFMPGDTAKTVMVQTTEDTTDEPDETFTLTLSSPSNVTLGDATATGTIRDTTTMPTIVQVAVTSTPLLTSSGGSTPDTYGAGEDIEFTVTFSAAVEVTGDPQFGFSLAGARVADYDSGSGSERLTFVYTVRSTDQDDDGIWVGNHASGNQTLQLDADDAITSLGGTDANLEHDILDLLPDHKVDGSRTADEPVEPLEPLEVTLHLSDADGEVAEDAGAVTVTATVSPASATAFTVTVSASPVAPATDDDFELSTNRALRFAGNATASSGTVTIAPVDDGDAEPNQVVTVSGSASIEGVTGPDDVTLTILDDDLTGGICARTPRVRDRILVLLKNRHSYKGDCSGVTEEHLAKLQSLDLGRNPSTESAFTMSLQSDDFEGLVNLERLYLRETGLSELPAGVFSGLAALDTLELDNNQLRSLPAGVFSDLQSLKTLELQKNPQLSSLPYDEFEALPKLTELLVDPAGRRGYQVAGGEGDAALEVAAGGRTTYQVRLTHTPAYVNPPLPTLTVSSDTAGVVATPATLRFTKENWFRRQTVTVNALASAAGATATLSHTSTGVTYDRPIPTVTVRVLESGNTSRTAD